LKDVILPQMGLRTTRAGSVLRGDHLIDFHIRLAKDEDCISCRFESALSGLLIRDFLFLLALGNTAKTLDSRQFLVGQIESRRRANQV